MKTADGYVNVAKVGEIAVGAVKIVHLDDVPVAIFRLDDGYYAMRDVCTHDGGPVAEGELDGGEIECPRHGARFDVRTGRALCLPAVTPVPTFAVRVQGDDIQVEWS